MKALAAALFAVTALAAPLQAADRGQLPAPTPYTTFPHSFRTAEFVHVPPYGLLPVRVYTTPPLGPFYNVPPYKVVAPY